MADVKDRRREAAAATQRAVVEAATRLFLERGYHATSMGDIAREAGSAVQTIYNAVGSKRDVLSRVLDFAVAGERAPTPVATFMREQAERESDPRRILEQMVEFWQAAMPAAAPVHRVIRQAAALDPEVAELERARAEQRLRNYGLAARLLADRGGLRAGLTIDDAAATIHAIAHPDVHRFLVMEQGWSLERWGAWVLSSLAAALLAPDAA